MKREFDFSDIEPYNDAQMRSVLQSLCRDEAFVEVMEYVFPDKDADAVADLILKIETVAEFQAEIAYTAIKSITDSTASDVVFSGVENIDAEIKHVFISNHRDIILDSALFNVLLFDKGIQTTETAIGDNLLGHPTVNALTKINKNFTVRRGLKGRELYFASIKLSTYISEAINKKRTSIWISQKEGRAKDGDDKTQKGLLKMLALSGGKDYVKKLKELNIRTLSISYEYDPCDIYKVKELLARGTEQDYIKGVDEDKMSIIAGITGRKGRVNFTVGHGIEDFLDDIGVNDNESDLLNEIGNAIDAQIYSNYKLWPNNYIAYDILHKKGEHSEHYSEADEAEFEQYMSLVLAGISDKQRARTILLTKYANPIINLFRSLKIRVH